MVQYQCGLAVKLHLVGFVTLFLAARQAVNEQCLDYFYFVKMVVGSL